MDFETDDFYSLIPETDAPSEIEILIADDNVTDRLLLSSLLKKLGYRVLVAEDGAEAVDIFKQSQPRLVFLDALMPVMDGFEAAHHIKHLAGEKFVPLIFISSLQDADSLARGLGVGGDSFLTKPYNITIIQAKINAYLRMADMHRTLRKQRDEIVSLNHRLMQEQEVAKRVFDKVAHAGCLDAPNIKYALSPITVFNGDVALAGVGPSGNLMVLLGDFTGHGLSAAIGAMPMAQAFYSMMEKGFGIKAILREINRKLNEILPVGVFCCTVFAEFDFVAGIVRVWNGGQPDAVLFHHKTGEVVGLPSHHLPLGIRDDSGFRDSVETLQVDVGDRLFLLTDGILEAEDDEQQMFGEERLLAVFANNKNPERLFNEINIAVNSFLGEGALHDDISLVEIRVVEPEQLPVTHEAPTAQTESGPRDWSLAYELRPSTLRAFDPLPLMLHVLQQVPYLRPAMGQIYTVMAELYSNALEHGVLNLDSALKSSAAGFTEYYRLRKERLAQLEEGVVILNLHYTGDTRHGVLRIEIEDSGEGFDHQALMRQDDNGSEPRRSYAGRGIHLLHSLCHSLAYLDKGNRVRAEFRWGQAVDDTRVLR